MQFHQDLATGTLRAMETAHIDDRKLAYHCVGSGSPTVILETGLGAESSEWSSIQHAIGAITRTFRYDRIGRGASDAAKSPRTAGDMVEDLHSLLEAARISGPYVLVGHSFGGLLMRLFAHRYPTEVGALLLLDGMNENQFDVIGSALPPPTPDDSPMLRDFREFWTGGWRHPESTAERIDFAGSFRQVKEVHSLGRLPIHIISAGTVTNSQFTPDRHRARLQSLWDGLQSRFLWLSPLATQSFALNSGHFVQREAPELVIEAIKRLIAAISPGTAADAAVPDCVVPSVNGLRSGTSPGCNRGIATGNTGSRNR
jgi:pimeloyl-ACP methyl ester carboxylesterase